MIFVDCFELLMLQQHECTCKCIVDIINYYGISYMLSLLGLFLRTGWWRSWQPWLQVATTLRTWNITLLDYIFACVGNSSQIENKCTLWSYWWNKICTALSQKISHFLILELCTLKLVNSRRNYFVPQTCYFKLRLERAPTSMWSVD
jgi:hypothetical protein